MSNLKPRRPYLFRAMFDWMLDNDLTPHILVDAEQSDVEVPTEFIKEGKIVLNIAPHSVGHFELTDDYIQFKARFSGASRQVIVPMAAVLAIYSREDGQGMGFEPEPQYENRSPSTVASDSDIQSHATKSKPTFTVVK